MLLKAEERSSHKNVNLYRGPANDTLSGGTLEHLPPHSGWWKHRCDVTNWEENVIVKKTEGELVTFSLFPLLRVSLSLTSRPATHFGNHKQTNPLTSNQTCPGFSTRIELGTFHISLSFRWASFASWCLSRRHSQGQVQPGGRSRRYLYFAALFDRWWSQVPVEWRLSRAT